MKLTNKFNLPLNLDRFKSKRPTGETLAVTKLIDSPRITYLLNKHWDSLETDVSDMLFLLEGQGVHAVLEGHVPESAVAEESLSMKVGDVLVTGRADQYDNNTREIIDWKGTSVWTYIKNKARHGTAARKEWIAQLNVYASLFEAKGLPVEKLAVWLWMRDWTERERLRTTDYPDCRLSKVALPLWSPAEREIYIMNRVALFNNVLEDGGNYICSDEETWASPETYAVMKKTRKTAVAVFGTDSRPGTIDDANLFAHGNPGTYVLIRPGGRIRCESYCSVRNVCELAKESLAKIKREEETAF